MAAAGFVYLDNGKPTFKAYADRSSSSVLDRIFTNSSAQFIWSINPLWIGNSHHFPITVLKKRKFIAKNRP